MYGHLRTGFILQQAHETLNYLIDQGYEAGGHVPLGAPLGNVLAWMWETSPDEVDLFVADLMAQLWHHDPLVGDGCPRVRFEDVLSSIPAALPHGFEGSRELVDHLRDNVPDFFGSDDLDS